MRLSSKVYNASQRLLELGRKYIYLILPTTSLILYVIFKEKILSENLADIENYTNNIISLSGILAGFLFTTFGTFMSLPDNKFLDMLENTGYFKSIYRIQLLGVLFLITAMMVGLFNLSIEYMTIFFILGISEALGSLCYFYRILTFSKKSNTKY